MIVCVRTQEFWWFPQSVRHHHHHYYSHMHCFGAIDLLYGGSQFEARQEHRLHWLTSTCFFPVLNVVTGIIHFKIGHNRNLSHTFPFITHEHGCIGHHLVLCYWHLLWRKYNHKVYCTDVTAYCTYITKSIVPMLQSLLYRLYAMCTRSIINNLIIIIIIKSEYNFYTPACNHLQFQATKNWRTRDVRWRHF